MDEVDPSLPIKVCFNSGVKIKRQGAHCNEYDTCEGSSLQEGRLVYTKSELDMRSLVDMQIQYSLGRALVRKSTNRQVSTNFYLPISTDNYHLTVNSLNKYSDNFSLKNSQ